MVCLSVSFAKTEPLEDQDLFPTASTTLQPLSVPLKQPHPLALAKPEKTVASDQIRSDQSRSRVQLFATP